MRPAPENFVNDPSLNKERYAAHTGRLATQATERQRQLDAKKATAARRSSLP
jgi:hypothetical protein